MGSRDEDGDMRYRHLQRMAEREARAGKAAQRAGEAQNLEQRLWSSLDAGERSRWTALCTLLEDEVA
jgi:hypothetical protein